MYMVTIQRAQVGIFKRALTAHKASDYEALCSDILS